MAQATAACGRAPISSPAIPPSTNAPGNRQSFVQPQPWVCFLPCRDLRDQQYVAEMLLRAHVLVASLRLGERISLVDRHLDAARFDVVPEVGAHSDEDFSDFLDRAGAEGDADIINALACMRIEVEFGFHAGQPRA